jgi:hypothetical protein
MFQKENMIPLVLLQAQSHLRKLFLNKIPRLLKVK